MAMRPIEPSQPFRWLPRHGAPASVLEFLSQGIVKALAYLPIYTAVVVSLMLLVMLFTWR